ncbi:putative bifunctional diguanylate cyclase/phosphodiesterase [Salinibacterium hongtaonis]|uniref:putative bifunctional diguanylate cyclase/phosphodiesterase n=1 Tax=Homoserinimonas hongtaonis TaxID=2079791 RepID=UPI000D39E87F|nr:EAL domain-containing protein [Salinibacterium hongtaonis]AWB88489.1 hypothetical protein C2138_02045 [Salinibacterium hongtaonis]
MSSTQERGLGDRSTSATLDDLALVLAAMPDPVVVVDDTGMIILVNDRVGAMLGYEEGELAGNPIETLIPTPLRRGHVKLRDNYDGTDRAATMSSRSNIFAQRKDGTAVPVEISIGGVKLASGSRITVATVRDITEKRRAHERLAYLALHDPLTGLANRAHLMETAPGVLSAMRTNAQHVGVLMLDLDHFKQVNDSLGHAAGDQLLIEIAQRIKTMVRGIDLVVRMGGDEFLVLMPRTSPEHIEEVGRQLVAVLSDPIELDEAPHPVTVGVSVGAVATDDPDSDIDALLVSGDLAMYRAKGTGRNRVSVFDEQLRTVMMSRFAIEGRLRRALDDDGDVAAGLAVNYQPLVDLDTGVIIGFEALVRLADGESPVGPDLFIPIAEEAGIVDRIDLFVLGQALRQTALWAEAGHPLEIVSVNLSASTIMSPELLVELDGAAQALGSAELHLELTERMIIQGTPPVKERLGLLRTNARLGLDDFGTGNSGYAYLMDFPIDFIKLDRTFVGVMEEDAVARAIVSSMVDFAEGLGLGIIAEGVETIGQVDLLRSEGCRIGQGFYYGRPLSAKEFGEVLARQSTGVEAKAAKPASTAAAAKAAK